MIRQCPGRGSARVSNTYVMVQNFEMRIYISIFFPHSPTVCFTKHSRSPFFYKQSLEGKEKKKYLQERVRLNSRSRQTICYVTATASVSVMRWHFITAFVKKWSNGIIQKKRERKHTLVTDTGDVTECLMVSRTRP